MLGCFLSLHQVAGPADVWVNGVATGPEPHLSSDFRQAGHGAAYLLGTRARTSSWSTVCQSGGSPRHGRNGWKPLRKFSSQSCTPGRTGETRALFHLAKFATWLRAHFAQQMPAARARSSGGSCSVNTSNWPACRAGGRRVVSGYAAEDTLWELLRLPTQPRHRISGEWRAEKKVLNDRPCKPKGGSCLDE
jgi:hypothetical protein